MTTLRTASPEVTDDAILNGRLRLFQPKRGHRFGHDAILLAAAVPARSGQAFAEFGAGVGAATLALLARVPEIDATLYEMDAALCALARENIRRNGFSNRARAVASDVSALSTERRFDHVLMNPPFNDPRHQPSPDPARRRAHAGPPALLASWIGSAQAALRDGGTVTLIWRAERLAEITDALAAGFGALSILPIHPAPGRPAIRVIATAEKAGNAPSRMLPPFVLNDEDARPTAQAEAILRQGAALPVADRT